jgi:cytochrome P450
MSLSYNPHDPAFLIDGIPFEQLQKIRAHQPICPTPTGAWYLSRFSDVDAVFRDVEGYYADLGPITGLSGVETIPRDQWFLSEIPEPKHAAMRRLFNTSFGPHRTKEIASYIRTVCDGLLDRMLEQDVSDLHVGYAMPIPSLVMANVLGLPESTSDLFMEWSFDGSLMTRPETPGVKPGRPAVEEYFLAKLNEQRALAEPDNHVFKIFLEARFDNAPLEDQEIITQLHFMIQAGVHTTRGLLVHVVQRLLEDPELFERLHHDPSLIPVYVEETLRHDSPVQRVTRRCAHATEIGGIMMAKDTWLEVGIASANRDESLYEDPESFRLDRPNPKNHLGFGGGPHICPGATLARAEAVTAVEVLLSRLHSMEVLPGASYPPIPGSLSHQEIPARLNPR